MKNKAAPAKQLSGLAYINRIFDNVKKIDSQQIADVYYDLTSAGVIIPSGEGRSKGAITIPSSEMAKMAHGKIVLDRSDTGFPSSDLSRAAPILNRRYGQVALLVNSGSGKSLTPLLDAQKLAYHVATSGKTRDFRIDLSTSNQNSPLSKLASKYGNIMKIGGRTDKIIDNESNEFRSQGIMDDIFTLSSGLIFHSMAEAMCQQSSPDSIITISDNVSNEISTVIDKFVESDYFNFLLHELEERKSCFFAGLGSSREVARTAAIRVAHVKHALGDGVFVAGESSTTSPRAGDVLIVISLTGETEIVASWCRNFKAIGGKVASLVGSQGSTIESLSDMSFVIDGDWKKDFPSSFYIKAAFLLSPLPIYIVERIAERGLRLPEFLLGWHRSVIS